MEEECRHTQDESRGSEESRSGGLEAATGPKPRRGAAPAAQVTLQQRRHGCRRLRRRRRHRLRGLVRA